MHDAALFSVSLAEKYFEERKFDPKKHIEEIKRILGDGPIFRQSYVEFNKMELLDILFELWKKYGSFPDKKLVSELYRDWNLNSMSYSQDLFAAYLFASYVNEIEFCSLDFFMHHLYGMKNIDQPISQISNLKNCENIQKINPINSFAYPYLKFGQVDLDYDGVLYRGLYLYIGDREDHVEAVLLDNGEYIAYGERMPQRI